MILIDPTGMGSQAYDSGGAEWTTTSGSFDKNGFKVNAANKGIKEISIRDLSSGGKKQHSMNGLESISSWESEGLSDGLQSTTSVTESSEDISEGPGDPPSWLYTATVAYQDPNRKRVDISRFNKISDNAPHWWLNSVSIGFAFEGVAELGFWAWGRFAPSNIAKGGGYAYRYSQR